MAQDCHCHVLVVLAQAVKSGINMFNLHYYTYIIHYQPTSCQFKSYWRPSGIFEYRILIPLLSKKALRLSFEEATLKLLLSCRAYIVYKINIGTLSDACHFSAGL